MRYTNKSFLPQAVVRAVTNDPYNKGDADFTVTELLRPPRQRALMITHAESLEEDVASRLWSLYGQIGHVLLERAGMPNDITEERYKVQVGKYTLSAQVDSLSLEDRVLTDWKFTTSYKFMAGRPKPEDYVWQLNMQKYILEHQSPPIHVHQLQIVGLLRDWQISKADSDKKYPQVPIATMPIEVKHPNTVETFILDRIGRHLSAEKELPRCTVEETWRGRRCWDYCSVNKHCAQYQELQTNQKERISNGRD